jgi:hypothetical protein
MTADAENERDDDAWRYGTGAAWAGCGTVMLLRVFLKT